MYCIIFGPLSNQEWLINAKGPRLNLEKIEHIKSDGSMVRYYLITWAGSVYFWEFFLFIVLDMWVQMIQSSIN